MPIADCRKEMMSVDVTNVWVIIVSIRHQSVLRLIRRALDLGAARDRIIVVSNRKDVRYEKAGIPSENILKKKTYGYVGALIVATEKVLQYDTGAIIVNVSSEYRGNMKLEKAKWTILSAILRAKRTHGVIIGSTTDENGIAVWRAEAIITTVAENNLSRNKTKFQDLVSKFGITVLETD